MLTSQKHFLILLLVLSLSSISYGQNEFTRALNLEKRPSMTKLKIGFSDSLNNEIEVPILIFKGKTSGPVFTIIAGVHGYEYPPIIAVQELLQAFNPDVLSGTLIVIPLANPASFYGRSPFVNPQDHINLNRTFPGNPHGTITQQIAHFITSSIIPASDVFLDIHGGDASEDLLPFVCYYKNQQNPKETELAKRLAEQSGFKHVVSYGYSLKPNYPAKYAFKQAVQDGKTALSIECGALGNVQTEAVALIKKGIYNMLAELKMCGTASNQNTNFTNLTHQFYIKSKHKGIFYSNFKAGDQVEKGEVIGHIKDEFGEILGEYKAFKSGIILYKIGTPPVNEGETIMCVGYE